MRTATLTPTFETWAARALDAAGLDLDAALAALVAGEHDGLPPALVSGWTSPASAAVLPAVLPVVA